MPSDLYIEPTYNKNNEIQDSYEDYDPSDEVKDRLQQVYSDYEIADRIRNKSYEEFNYRDLTGYINDNQRAFNSFIPSDSDNPDDSWRANTVRPLTRNKCISIAAHVTASILYPNIVAQNRDQEKDRDAAMVMKDIVRWTYERSEYDKTFIYSVISALYNPCVILEDGYAEVRREVKEMTENGYETKEILDEVWSGFYNELVPPEELYIGNVYEKEIQKQPFLIRRRFINYSEAQVKYNDNELFNKHVRPGVRYFYADDQDIFYEQRDEDMEERLVEEVIYYNRLSDLELRIINGVLIDEPERPMQRKDKMYPFAHSGFEPFDDSFFYFKPLTDKIAPDQNIIDVLYNLAIDSSLLQTMPPGVIYGDSVDASVVVPGRVTSFDDEAEYKPLETGTNMNAAINMLQKVESSASESSTPDQVQGQSPAGANTAYEIATMNQNAMKVLGLFGKMIKFLVEDFGELRMKTALQYLTVADASKTQSDTNELKFKNILVEKGKSKPRKIEFTQDMPESEEELKEKEFELLEREVDKDMEIAQVNPKLFRNLKYKAKVEADMEFTESESVRKALNLEAYDRLIGNPQVDQKAVTRDFLLRNYAEGEEEKYLKEQAGEMPMPGQGGEGTDITEAILKQAGAKPPAGA